jgi:hypothetical protein
MQEHAMPQSAASYHSSWIRFFRRLKPWLLATYPSSRVTMLVYTRRGTLTPPARPTAILGGGTGFRRKPQMPYANTLDLVVFPCMLKRHTQLLRQHGNSVIPNDDIWKAAQEVWNDLESYVIARGFVLACRIAAKVIEGEGGNDFLNNADFHCEVRKDFANTATGIKRACVINI